jgi:hypothetical protein
VASAVQIKFSTHLIQFAFYGFDLEREFSGVSGRVPALLKKDAILRDSVVADGLQKLTLPAVHNFSYGLYLSSFTDANRCDN